jgi:hypothetical protein
MPSALVGPRWPTERGRGSRTGYGSAARFVAVCREPRGYVALADLVLGFEELLKVRDLHDRRKLSAHLSRDNCYEYALFAELQPAVAAEARHQHGLLPAP